MSSRSNMRSVIAKAIWSARRGEWTEADAAFMRGVRMGAMLMAKGYEHYLHEETGRTFNQVNNIIQMKRRSVLR